MRQDFTIYLPIGIIVVSGLLFLRDYLDLTIFISIGLLCLLIIFIEFIITREEKDYGISYKEHLTKSEVKRKCPQ